MKISDILKAGATIGAAFFPPLAAVIPVVNAFMPSGQKLAETATGSEVSAAIATLPPEQQSTLLGAEIDLEKTKVIEHTKVISELAKVDATGNSTRPDIAVDFSRVISYVVILIVTMWAVAVYNSDTNPLSTINESWPFILAIITPLLAVIRSYFGMRTDEKNTRQHAANGTQAPLKGIANLISMIRK